mmetsp:Transcript_95879/g.273381  ORF Transcript_95879/g.273381 Transcript_95879/m.273381 type:complete len:303 (-) Transcript_95879:492-1400(-)|eukprot:CAMPEP_0119477578 /NCGR_PEP_ID=MMETSP1344-20130328/7670_1 /TAXON_ID=236787 /ORGANISM="Florenciella parvula, Strain CCMP2471" /LENGTH=302 /DNA_ID=CAMNT_0007511613 /DNA_START=75 /DNA_END=983 /DNA_ORIENTATION=+
MATLAQAEETAATAPPSDAAYTMGERSGMQFVIISSGAATVTIYLHGSHVASWQHGGKELLFMSENAVYNGTKALRGGIPVCFPQFGDLGPCKAQHGFARNLPWTLVGVTATATTTTARFALCSVQPESEFPFPYHLTNEVTVSGAERTLAQELVVANPGTTQFSFTTALHTYFKVNALEATVGGLRGCKYLDSLDGRVEKVDLEEEVCFASEVDRIYMGVPRVVTVSDSSVNFDIGTTATLSDGIVWNPWIAKAASMKDYGDEEWRDHVCHEAGRAASGPVTLAPGEVWSGTQTITAHISS